MKHVAWSAWLCALVLFSSCRPSPEKLLATADKYHANKKYKEAAILYQKVILKDKKNAEAYYRGGLNLIDEGKPVEAVPYLRRAVDLKPDNKDAEAKLAEIYLTAYLGNPSRWKSFRPEIEDLIKKLFQHDPNSFDAERIQAILDLSDKKFEDAVQQFARANSAQPHSRQLVGWYAEALVAAGHTDQAEALVQDMLLSDKTWGPGYDFLFILYRNTQNLAKEESILRRHWQNDPKSAAAVVNLSNFLLATGRYGEAESVIKHVLDDKQAFPNGRQLLGDFYARARKFDDALQQYQTASKEDPAHSLLYDQRVVLTYTMMGRREDAIRLAKSLTDKNPRDASINEIYASLLLETDLRKDTGKAVNELKTLSKNNPSDAVLHLDLSKAYLATNDLEKGLSETLEALQDELKSRAPRQTVLIPSRLIAARIYQSRGQHAQSLDQANQILQVQPQSPDARLLKDQALIGLTQADEAQSDLEALVQQYPKLNDARLALAGIYLNQKNFGKAGEQYDELWRATPQDVRGYLGLQEIKLAEGKPDEAVRAMSDLVNKNPNSLPFRFQLAGFQTAAGQIAMKSNAGAAKTYFEQAADNYKQILKTNANSAELWLRLGNLQQALGQLDPALASFEQASHADPRSAQALVDRGVLLAILNRKKEASDLYNQALGIDPNNPIALNNLAFLNAENGTNLEQAMSFAERAKKQAPKSPDVSDTLGYVYLRRNLNDQALEIFRQNVQDHPQNPTFRLHLAMALLKRGDKQGARDEAARAMKIAPPDQQQQIKTFVSQIG